MQDLRNLMLILWQRLWLVLAATVLGGVLALWGMVKIGQFPNYSATAVVAIGGDVYYNAQDAAYLEMADAMIENYRRLAGLDGVGRSVRRPARETPHRGTSLVRPRPGLP